MTTSQFEPFAQGRLWKALAAAEQSAAAFREIGSERSGVGAQTAVGMLQVALGDVAHGIEVLRESLATAQRIGQRFPISYVQTHLPLALAASPELALREEARTLALKLTASVDSNPWQRGVGYTALARLSLACGDLAEAEAQARVACELLTAFATYKVFARPCLVTALLAQNRAAEAREVAVLGLQEHEQLGGSYAFGVAQHLALAEACFALNDSAAGDAALRECLQYLRARADDISEPMARERFLHQVPENHRALARQRGSLLVPS